MMRAAALGRLGRQDEARTAVGEMLKLTPDFASRGRWLIGRYVKVDDLIDTIIEGLRKAGLADIE
jgi:adenylate cyclase